MPGTRQLMVAALMAAVAIAAADGLPSGSELRAELRAEVRGMPSLLRYYSFEDIEGEGLTFVPGEADGTFEITEGCWPEQKSLRIDRGSLQSEIVDIPDEGFTVSCWFRHNGVGGLTHFNGKPAYSSGGIVAAGNSWRDGWRVVVSPSRSTASFSIGRPDVGAISAKCTGVQEGRWHHLAATWDRRYINVYLDGNLRAEAPYDGPYTPGSPRQPFRIGEVSSGVGTIKLDVAELALFGEALSPELIARLADPLARQREAIVACLLRGGEAGGQDEQTAREQYRLVLALDAAENPFVLGNYQAIARLRIAESLRREGKWEQAREECARLAQDEAAPLHYRAPAMALLGDTYRDERRYEQAREAYRAMLEFFTGRHENFRVEALHRLADVEGLADGAPFVGLRQRRIDRISHPGREMYVATDGDDANPGTEQAPFATLERARDAIRALKQAGPLPEGGVAVYLRGGVYSRTASFALGEDDSGTLDAPVVYRSYPGETAVLSGGVDLTGFRPVMEAGAPERLPAEARAHVMALDLQAAGVEDLGSMQPRGFALQPVPAHLELFFDDQPMQLARWPNPVGTIAGDYTTIAGFAGEDVGDFLGKPMAMDNAFIYGDDRQAKWADEPDAWLLGYWARWYAARYLPVAAVEPEIKTIRIGEPYPYHRASSEYKSGGVLKGAPYFGVNLLCELDTPGEFYVDRETGMLYFWPPAPVAEGRCVASVLEEPLLSLEDASHVVFRGLTLEAGRADGVIIQRGDGVLLAGCVIRNMGNGGIIVGDTGSGATPVGDLTIGGWNHGVIGCDIHDTGDGGVALIGGDVKSLTPSGHFIENCHLHHFDRWNRAGYQPAVALDGVGCRVSHNLIHDGPHQGVHLRRNDHIFEYNEVHDTPYEAREMGLYYMYGRYRVLGERGNIARYNYFHHVPYTDALAKDFVGGGRAIFHIDHMNGGMTIYGNIFQAHESNSGCFFSGGRSNMVENNIFYDCLAGISLGDRSFVWDKIGERGQQLTLDYLRGMPHDQPPWSLRYPDLATLPDLENPSLPAGNLAARNIGVKVAELIRARDIARELATIEHNWDGPDPGFADPEQGDFTIRPDSKVFGEIGFDPIPVGSIGLYQDELRATWPVQHEVDTHEHMSVTRKPLDELPTCRAEPRTAPITIDGTLDPAEWDGADPAAAITVDRSPHIGPSDALPSYAWIRRDGEALYIGLLNEVNPEAPLTRGSRFFGSDMVEVIIEGQMGVGTQGWWADEREHGPLLYLVGDFKGAFDSLQMAGLPREPAEKLKRTVSYGARVMDASHWSAEWRIPFASVFLDPQKTEACCFNIGVEKRGTPVDESWPRSRRVLADWAAWVGTQGSNWEVWNAGRLLLKP